MSSIMKGIVDEGGENVSVIYINDKAATKYAKAHEAEADAKRLRAKFPDKKIEVKQEVRETEAKKGADGKRCWKGKRFAGTENGKDKCIPVKENMSDLDEARPMSPGLRAAQKNLVDLASGEVRKREDAKRAAAKRQREWEREANRKPKKPTLDQIWQKVEHAISNYFPDGDPTDYLNPYMERNNLTWDDITRAAKRNGYKDLWDYWNTLSQDIENDAYYDWQAAKRPEAPKNPLSKDAADIQHRDWVAKKNPQIRTRAPFMEDPYDAVEEDTAYATGMGQGGNAGQSYRKFKPKSAGTFKESAIMKGIKREGL